MDASLVWDFEIKKGENHAYQSGPRKPYKIQSDIGTFNTRPARAGEVEKPAIV